MFFIPSNNHLSINFVISWVSFANKTELTLVMPSGGHQISAGSSNMSGRTEFEGLKSSHRYAERLDAITPCNTKTAHVVGFYEKIMTRNH